MKQIPKYLAIHEAAHAVASHLMQKQLGWSWNQFQRIVVRTKDEIAAGPFVDRRGRRLDLCGIVETSDRYQALGKVADRIILKDGAPLPEMDRRNLIAAWRSAMEADVIDSLAGPVAEIRCRYRWGLLTLMLGINRGMVRFRDFEHARQKISDFTRTNQETDKMFFALLERSWRLIGRNWPAVTGLAAVLREQRVIEAEDAVRIIEGAS